MAPRDGDDERDREWSPYMGPERERYDDWRDPPRAPVSHPPGPARNGPADGGYLGGGSSGIGGLAHGKERQRRSGRPPRAYRRSDDRIRDDIYDRLLRQDWIDAYDVEVQVKDGEVTLTGTVPSRQEKRAVEGLADDVLGVTEIHNQLRVGPREALPSGGRSEA